MGEISEREASLIEKSQVKEELESSYLVDKLGGGWPEKFITEL